MQNINRRKNKKGIGMVECIIAILLFSIVTSMALSVSSVAQRRSVDEAEHFKSSLTAYNVLACFQSADSIDNFDSLATQTGISCIGEVSDTIDGGSRYDEFTPTDTTATPFAFIRAHEDLHTVEFYNADGTKPLTRIEYATESAYQTARKSLETQNILDSQSIGTPIYEKSDLAEKNDISSITVGSDDFSFVIDLSKGSVTITATSVEKGKKTPHTKTYTATNFEKALFVQHHFLYLNQNSIGNHPKTYYDIQTVTNLYQPGSTETGNYMYFNVYDMLTGKPVRDATTGNYLVYRISLYYPKKVNNKLTQDIIWYDDYNDSVPFNVTKIESAWSSIAPSDTSFYPTSGYTTVVEANEQWFCFPKCIFDSWQNIGLSSPATSYVAPPTGNDGMPIRSTGEIYKYYDFTIKKKDGQFITPSNLNSVLYNKNDTLKFYNSSGRELFETKSTKGNNDAAISALAAADSCKFTESTVIPVSGGFSTYCCQNEGTQIKKVVFTDGGTSADSKITFHKDGKGYSYVYTAAHRAQYIADRDKIISESGTYKNMYDATLHYTAPSRTATVDHWKNNSTVKENLTTSTGTNKALFYSTYKYLLKTYYNYYLYTVNTSDTTTLSAVSEKSRTLDVSFTGTGAVTYEENISADATLSTATTVTGGSLSGSNTGSKTKGATSQPSADYSSSCTISNFSTWSNAAATCKTAFEKSTSKAVTVSETNHTKPSDFTPATWTLTSHDITIGNIHSADPTTFLPVIRKSDSSYDLVLRDKANANDVGTTVFSGKPDSIVFVNGPLSDADFTAAGSGVSDTYITRYYKYAYGRYGLIIEATYSRTLNDVNAEPRINIWDMKSEDIRDITALTDLTDTFRSAHMTTESQIIKYRKG